MAKLPVVTIAYPASPAERAVFQEALANLAQLTYTANLPPAEQVRALHQAEIVLSWGLPRTWVAEMKAVHFWQLLSAGVENLPYDLLSPETIVAANVGAYAEPMAEHMLAMALALAKRLYPAHQRMKNGDFNQFGSNLMLHGGVVAILGFGGIGQEIARLLQPFGMKIQVINRTGQTDLPVDFCGTLDHLEQVLRSANFIFITLPHTRTTDGLIGARELGWMREDAILINAARGPIIQEAALYRHLVSHPYFMAGLDVWWSEPFSDEPITFRYPFLDLPNLLGTPHSSAIAGDSLIVGARRAAENVLRYLKDEPLRGLVRREDYL